MSYDYTQLHCYEPEVHQHIIKILETYTPYISDDIGYLSNILIVMIDTFHESCCQIPYECNSQRSVLFQFWLSRFEFDSEQLVQFLQDLFQYNAIKLFIAHVIVDFKKSLPEIAEDVGDDVAQGMAYLITPLYQQAMMWLMQLRQENTHTDDLVILSVTKN